MLGIALFQPEIPPNTGNIIRLCANSGADLHLIEPLGFRLDDARLRRAGLDYHEWARVKTHADMASFLSNIAPRRLLACSTHGQQCYSDITYQSDDILLLGPETRGLPATLLADFPAEHVLKIPMVANSRSLNLSNAAAIILFEAWRQLGFVGS